MKQKEKGRLLRLFCISQKNTRTKTIINDCTIYHYVSNSEGRCINRCIDREKKKEGKTDKQAKAMVERDRNKSLSKKKGGKRTKREKKKRRSYKDVKAVYLTATLQFTGTAPLARSQHVPDNNY
jgi:hypothetical protein